MSKQYRKESLGRIDGSISSGSVFTLPHSPEQEQNLQKLVERIQPIFMQGVQQAINLYLEETYEINQGDFVQYITNYIQNYFNTYVIGQILTAGNGILISGNTISVRAGEGLETASGPLNVDLATNPGLEITSEKLEAKPNTAAALNKDAQGLKVVLSGTVETGSGATGGGLSFDGTSGVRVNPEDFLYLGP